MKLARRLLQSVAAPKMDLRNDDDDDTTSSGSSSSGADSPGNQLVVANKSKSKSKNSNARALSRKTRSVVKAWIEKLSLSDKNQQTKKNGLTHCASTGSITGCSSSSGFEIGDSAEPRAKRRSSFFSSSRGKENSNSSNAKKDKSSPMWLQPMPSFPPIECESQVSSSHEKKTPVTASSLALDVHEPGVLAYVVPPVEMPTNYRNQDRHGGMIVSGRAVLFTNAAFKRKLRNLSQLRVIPENRPAQMHESHLDVYLSALKYVESGEPLASSYSSDNGDDEIVPLSQWI